LQILCPSTNSPAGQPDRSCDRRSVDASALAAKAFPLQGRIMVDECCSAQPCLYAFPGVGCHRSPASGIAQGDRVQIDPPQAGPRRTSCPAATLQISGSLSPDGSQRAKIATVGRTAAGGSSSRTRPRYRRNVHLGTKRYPHPVQIGAQRGGCGTSPLGCSETNGAIQSGNYARRAGVPGDSDPCPRHRRHAIAGSHRSGNSRWISRAYAGESRTGADVR
jgi:hypothetical protein